MTVRNIISRWSDKFKDTISKDWLSSLYLDQDYFIV